MVKGHNGGVAKKWERVGEGVCKGVAIVQDQDASPGSGDMTPGSGGE